MRTVTRSVVIVCCCVVLAALAGASAGCGTSAGTGGSGWKQIATADVSGKEPAKVNLGRLRLGSAVRLTFVPSGPVDPQVKLTLLVLNAEKAGQDSRTITPQRDPEVFRGDRSITMSPVSPGLYRVFFSQQFDAADGPGYDLKLTVFTRQ